jgi:hypothetical protein
VTSSGGGVKERLEAASKIDASMSQEQLYGAAKTWNKLLDGQIRGFERSWNNIPGNKGKDFYKQFSLKTGGGEPGGAPAGGGDADFIAKAKAAGYTDEQIQQYLKNKGAAPPQAPKLGG